MDYKEKISRLPSSPGVYIMKDNEGRILYVGKAANLKKRVSSYFYPKPPLSERISVMAGKVEDIGYIPTSTEAEALIYENSLIKQLAPKYNVALRDDKSYPMLKLTAQEKFPRLFITRKKCKDGSFYYGPYTSAKLLRQALIILRQIFQLRSCGKMPKNVCLNYHIKQCLAPCVGYVDKVHYDEVVSELKLFLEGKKTELVNRLTEKMLEAVQQERFEDAGQIKARIEALSSVKEKSIGYGAANEIEELRNILGIKHTIDVIEAFDVSNIMGKEAVGSMVSFYKGRPKKAGYRKFKIKTVHQMDDYGMMREIVRRRYSRLPEEKKERPDLIIIDGGKGHLAAAIDELRKIGLSGVPIIGIAKPARLSQPESAGGEFEHIYLKDKFEPLVLPKESKALYLLKRVRDEAHRFAISYHKSLRSKGLGASVLDSIPGIGAKRKRMLLGHFGSIDRIKRAGLDELLKLRGMNEKAARSVIGYFKEQ